MSTRKGSQPADVVLAAQVQWGCSRCPFVSLQLFDRTGGQNEQRVVGTVRMHAVGRWGRVDRWALRVERIVLLQMARRGEEQRWIARIQLVGRTFSETEILVRVDFRQDRVAIDRFARLWWFHLTLPTFDGTVLRMVGLGSQHPARSLILTVRFDCLSNAWVRLTKCNRIIYRLTVGLAEQVRAINTIINWVKEKVERLVPNNY